MKKIKNKKKNTVIFKNKITDSLNKVFLKGSLYHIAEGNLYLECIII